MKKLFPLIFITNLFSQGLWMMNNRVHSELDWTTMKTEHFIIHYHNGIEDIGLKGATIAEQVIPILMKQMDITELPIIDVIFTTEDEVLNGYAVFTNQTFIWVDQNDASIWLEDEKWLFQVLSHELQHIVFFNAIKTWMSEPWSIGIFGQIPSWFVEGLAEYYTEKWRPYRSDISHKYHVLTNTTSKMDPHHDGYSKVLYLSEKFGDEAIVKIVQYRNKFKLFNFKKAFKKATGVSPAEFEEDWRRTINTYFYGYRSQKEAIEELGKTATLPIEKMNTFLISSDSLKIAIVGRDDEKQFDNSFFIATRDTSKSDNKKFSLDFNFSKLINFIKADTSKQDSLKKWKKPSFKKEEIDYGRFHPHLSWSIDNKKIVFSKYRRGQYGSMLWDVKIYNTESKKAEWITDNMRATYPVWLNEEEIIFIAHQNSTANIYKINLTTKEKTQLTDFSGDVSVVTPALSPDRKSLIFAMAPESGNTDLYLLNLINNSIERLTQHPAVDYLPVWEPNGKRIAYTSHSSSTPNVHVLELENNSTHQITDVGDAVWTHQWTPTDSTLLLKTLPDTDSTRLVMVDLNRKFTTSKLNLRNRYTSWMTKSPDYPLNPIDYSNIPQINSTEDYSFFNHIKHYTSIIFPFPIPFGETAWTDALGKHQIIINGGSYDYSGNLPFGGINYINAQHGPLWGINLNYNQDFKFRNYDGSSTGLTELKNGIKLWISHPFNSGESLSSNHSFSSSFYFGKLNIYDVKDYQNSTMENGIDTLILVDHNFEINGLPIPEGGDLGIISIGYRYLSRRGYRDNSFFPHEGYGLDVKLDFADKLLMSDFNYTQFSIDGFNNYKMSEMVFYSRLKGVLQSGNPPAQDKVNFSTDEATYVPMIGITESLPENINLRGSSQFRSGNRLLFGTFEIRQKLLEGDLPINILGFTGGDITGAIISDFGNVWDGNNESGEFISTAGYEIKISFKSGGMPIMIFAYGYADEINNISRLENLNHYYRMVLINPF
jgi:hypothetical protein